MMTLRGVERSDRRILGAIRAVDVVTGLQIPAPIQLQATGVKFTRNRRGLYILWSAPGFESYSQAFQDLPGIAPRFLTIQAIALSGQYLPRRFSLELPRTADPTQADQPDSLFQPAVLGLYPAPQARAIASWAVIRATVVNAATQHRLPWALLHVTRASDPAINTLSQADWRGEALIAVPGIPVTMSATEAETPEAEESPVVVTAVEAAIAVTFDNSLQTFSETADLSLLPNPNPTYVPDPDDLQTRRSELPGGTLLYSLSAGGDRAERLAVTLT